jgi:hypothetical protein
MTNRRLNNIEAEVMYEESGRLDEIAFVVRNPEGKDLTAQEIIDAVSDMLLFDTYFQDLEMQDESRYDA